MKRILLSIDRGTIKRITVNRHIVATNRVHEKFGAPLSVQTSKGVFTGHEVFIGGLCKLKYTPDKPLSCGATVYIETHASVQLTTLEPEGADDHG